AAARQLFDVDPAGLTVAQAALLAGLPQAPSRYDPIRHPAAARARQRYVLDRMRAAGFIDEGEYEAARAEPITIAGRPPVVWDAAPWYADYVRTLLEQEYGSAFATLGLQVHTAVDLRLQHIADEVLAEGLRSVERQLGRQRTVRHLGAAEIDDFLERQRGS